MRNIQIKNKARDYCQKYGIPGIESAIVTVTDKERIRDELRLKVAVRAHG